VKVQTYVTQLGSSYITAISDETWLSQEYEPSLYIAIESCQSCETMKSDVSLYRMIDAHQNGLKSLLVLLHRL
jgi:hypothetical protein